MSYIASIIQNTNIHCVETMPTLSRVIINVRLQKNVFKNIILIVIGC